MERLIHTSESLQYRSAALKHALIRELRYRSPIELTDRQLLSCVDPFLDQALTANGLSEITSAIGTRELAVDYGSGRNPFRALVLGRAREIYAIDPAYYSYNILDFPTNPTQPASYGVFGGRGEKQELIQLSKQALKHISIPTFTPGNPSYELTGYRHGGNFDIHLIPEYVERWLDHASFQTPLSIVWRAFPSAITWGDILAKIPIGGVLITTGYGQTRPLLKVSRNVDNYESLACGVDVDNSALPRNGNTGAIGLEPLIKPSHILKDPIEQKTIYFYRKIRHIAVSQIESALLRNLS